MYCSRSKYLFSFDQSFLRIFGLQIALGIVCFAISKFVATPGNYVVALPFIGLSIWYSFIELDKRLDLKGLIINFKNKKGTK